MMLVIRIPGQIPKVLNPNAHVNHFAKNREQQRVKSEAKAHALQATQPHERNGGNYRYAVTIGLAKGEIQKDDDNAASMTKHYRDGLALGLGCKDDKGWQFAGVTQVRDPDKTGYVEFRLEEI